MDGRRRGKDLLAEQVSCSPRAVCKLTVSNILAGLAGITSDANSLVNFARNAAQRHLFTYDEDIPVEMLVQRLCDMKQGYTQYGGEFATIKPPDILVARGSELMGRSATIRCLVIVHRLGPAARLPAVPVRPVRQLLGLEGDMYRREPLVRHVAAQAGLQGGSDARGREEPVSEGHEQDDGFDEARQREAYVNSSVYSHVHTDTQSSLPR